MLQKAAATRTPPPYDWLLEAPELRPLRGDPRFQSILEAARTHAGLWVKRLEQALRRGELPPYLGRPLKDLGQRLNGPDSV